MLPRPRLAAGHRVRQVATLYGALIASIVFGVAASALNTRFLEPEQFGNFKLLQTIWSVGVVFVTFGLFTTGGNFLAQAEARSEQRAVFGGMVAIGSAVAIVFAMALLVVSPGLGRLYGTTVEDGVAAFALLAIGYPMQLCLQESLRGTNDIGYLSLLRVLPHALYIGVALPWAILLGLSLESAVAILLASLLITTITITVAMRPQSAGAGAVVRRILEKNATLGWHVYVATLTTTLTMNLGVLMLGYLRDANEVAIFALALTITMPLALIPNAIGTSYFKEFSTAKEIPPNVLVGAVGLALGALVAFLLVVKPLVSILFTDRFFGAVWPAMICAVASVVHGMGDVYNRFLLAHGETRKLRVNANVIAAVSVTGYTTLVYLHGAMGAAVTKLLIAVTYLGMMDLYYRRLRVVLQDGPGR